MDVVRRHRSGPHDPVLVVVLLHDRGHDAARPDAVAAAEQRPLLAVLVEERRLERLRVEAAEVEDVTDLDGDLEAQLAAALRAPVARLRLAQVCEARLVVAARLGSAEMEAVAIRAGYELPRSERLVRDDLALEADRAEGPSARAERGADLLVRRRARLARQGVVE